MGKSKSGNEQIESKIPDDLQLTSLHSAIYTEYNRRNPHWLSDKHGEPPRRRKVALGAGVGGEVLGLSLVKSRLMRWMSMVVRRTLRMGIENRDLRKLRRTDMRRSGTCSPSKNPHVLPSTGIAMA